MARSTVPPPVKVPAAAPEDAAPLAPGLARRRPVGADARKRRVVVDVDLRPAGAHLRAPEVGAAGRLDVGEQPVVAVAAVLRRIRHEDEPPTGPPGAAAHRPRGRLGPALGWRAGLDGLRR